MDALGLPLVNRSEGFKAAELRLGPTSFSTEGLSLHFEAMWPEIKVFLHSPPTPSSEVVSLEA